MTDFSTVKENLEAKGFRVSTFETAQAAAETANGPRVLPGTAAQAGP